MTLLGALIVGVFAIAVPAILLLSIWAGVTAWRLLFSPQPVQVSAARARAGHGTFVPVGVQDIVADQRARQRVAPETQIADPHPWAHDLWLRRN